MRGSRTFVLGGFGLFTVVAASLVVSTVAGGPEGPPPLFSFLWLSGVGWAAYWWLFRIAAEVELEGTTLRWRTPLRTGQVDLADLTQVRPAYFGSNLAVFELSEGRSPMVFVVKGFSGLAEEIRSRRPDLPVRSSLVGRFNERMPGRSRLRR